MGRPPLCRWAPLTRVEDCRVNDCRDCLHLETGVYDGLDRRAGDKTTASYTFRQGQHLAFIYYYTKLNGQPPSEVEIQRHFKVSPPSVHDMILMLEKKGLIARTPGAARSVRVLLPREQLPDLE